MTSVILDHVASADPEAEHAWTSMRVALCAADDAKAACQLALK